MKKINLYTLEIPEYLKTQLSFNRNKAFKDTGDPSFKVFDPQIILGITNDIKIKDKILYPSSYFTINKEIAYNNQFSYIKVNVSKLFLNSLNLIKVEDTFKLFPYNSISKISPIIYIGSQPSIKCLNKNVDLDDYRINLIETKFCDNYFEWKIINSKHLSKDK